MLPTMHAMMSSIRSPTQAYMWKHKRDCHAKQRCPECKIEVLTKHFKRHRERKHKKQQAI